MKALILRAAGTNCDLETAHAFERVGMTAERRHVNELLAEPTMLQSYRVLAIPGGFSYGDDVAAGRVLATELRERVVPQARKLVEDGGLILGICNGFQVLVKTGLLPGLTEQDVTLTHNASHRYIDKWVELEVDGKCAFLTKGESFYFPIAHAEGKLVADEATLDRLERDGMVALRYRDNPNGSLRSIAGLTDATGRILGLMPHPERHMEPWHHPTWTRDGLSDLPDGLRFFQQAVAAVS